MTTLFDSRRIVKPASFGRGVLPSDRSWASDADYRRHVEETTFSAAEWRALQEEARAASLDRYHRDVQAEAQELAELGLSDEAMERLAAESAELDRLCGLPTPAALAAAEGEPVAEVRVIQVRGKRYAAETIAAEDEEVLAAVRLTGPEGQVYDVARTVWGFSCDCPDAIFRHESGASACKHVVACNAAGLLDPPAATPRKPRPRTLHQAARARRLAMA